MEATKQALNAALTLDEARLNELVDELRKADLGPAITPKAAPPAPMTAAPAPQPPQAGA